MSTAKAAEAKVAVHEAVCAERYKSIDDTLRRMEQAIHDIPIAYKADMAALKLEVTALAARINMTELSRAANTGAKSLATEVREWMPAIGMLGALALFYFKHAT